MYNNYYSGKISVSIVSHNHGPMVWRLVNELTDLAEINQIIVTLNIPEYVPINLSEKIFLVQNNSPKGFGENHNAAFNLVNCEFFCVLNPDIELVENPFPVLISNLSNKLCGLIAPKIININGVSEDNMRQNLTPWRLLKRAIGLRTEFKKIIITNNYLRPDWVAGMFMLFRSEVFDQIGGFDKRYYMYCEDVDICKRIWKMGYYIIGCLDVSAIHKAQRASHKNLRHFCWHTQSLILYFYIHIFKFLQESKKSIK